jgi:hypothetical protein
MNKPISMWGYFGYQILFSLPVVGWIFVIVLSFASPNVNVRNFARSYFCILIIVAVLAGIAMVTGGTLVFAELFSSLLQ